LLLGVRFRIGQLGLDLGQGIHHFLGAIDHPHRLAAPFHVQQHARLDLADIDLDRRTGCLGPLAREHAQHKGHRSHDCRRPTDYGGGRNQEPPFVAIHCLFTHNLIPNEGNFKIQNPAIVQKTRAKFNPLTIES